MRKFRHGFEISKHAHTITAKKEHVTGVIESIDKVHSSEFMLTVKGQKGTRTVYMQGPSARGCDLYLKPGIEVSFYSNGMQGGTGFAAQQYSINRK